MKSSAAQLFKKFSVGFRENIGTTFEWFQYFLVGKAHFGSQDTILQNVKGLDYDSDKKKIP